jgi:hypothetical protein
MYTLVGYDLTTDISSHLRTIPLDQAAKVLLTCKSTGIKFRAQEIQQKIVTYNRNFGCSKVERVFGSKNTLFVANTFPDSTTP